MKVDIVAFHKHVNLGGSHKLEALNLSQPQMRAFVESMDYDPATGEVTIRTTVRCPMGKGKARVLRIPASNVAGVWEEQGAVVAPAKKVDKTGLVTA